MKIIATDVEVNIKWEEELVDNERSNFYVRLKPHATLKKLSAMDAAGNIIGRKFLEESKKDLKGKLKHVKVS